MKKTLLVFLAGGVGYCALETLWRGRTHPSMALCGGTAVALFRKMAPRAPDRLTLCLRGGALITGCELLCGLVFNRDRRVWDYSRLPGNYRGQICPLFSALWCLLCLPLSALCPVLERHLALLDKPEDGRNGGRRGLRFARYRTRRRSCRSGRGDHPRTHRADERTRIC